ncbi:MAG: DnaK suppressor protein [Elusimicrobia bacterium]|nr:MAG: DnaK suppressor protein [Elusimicrobiota bacterium]KAF0155965.1 MAG: DnaK suppressor protein [Elusimicrobiota bacterium]
MKTSKSRPAKKAAKTVKKAAPAKAKKPAKKAAPDKGQAGGGRKEAEQIKKKLLVQRETISRTVEAKKNLDLNEPEVGDSIDQATQSLDKEILFELSDNERLMLEDIEAALRKIDHGIYGVCEQCQKPIAPKRLNALPSARYCLTCQAGAEKRRSY